MVVMAMVVLVIAATAIVVTVMAATVQDAHAAGIADPDLQDLRDRVGHRDQRVFLVPLGLRVQWDSRGQEAL